MNSTQKLSPLSLSNVTLADKFWKPRWETIQTVTLPLEYKMNKKTGALKAYQWEWLQPGETPPPWRIWVGDVGKWIEAACYILMGQPDEKLAALVENAVENILKGQKEDGYLYSNPVEPNQRWTNLRDQHELYDVGHTIEGAIAYYQATGNKRFVDAMCCCADLLDANFGWEKGKKRGYDGHEEIELALVKLYRITGEKRYLNLAKFFIDARGQAPNYFELEARARGERVDHPWRAYGSKENFYKVYQAHQPVRDQREAVGHSVRALYLYSGMADVAVETGDRELLTACKRLWKSVTHKRMYVIGGVGSTAHGEAFTFDYDLPNETAYAETCANIALVFFAHRMLQIEADSEYADVMERALYNGVLSGISLDGRTFFYANHLTVFPGPSKSKSDHVATTRQEWFGCACCPPNLARLIASIGKYAYSTSVTKAIYVHLYLGGSVECELGGRKVILRQETDYPWQETVNLTVETDIPASFVVALRVPGWCRGAKLKVNGKPVRIEGLIKKGYALLKRQWAKGDRLELTLPMPVEHIEAHPSVRMDCGKVALQRGPIVYCLEEADNGKNLADLVLPRKSLLEAEYHPKLLGGVVTLNGKAKRRETTSWKDALYRSVSSKIKDVNITAIPYYVWANRKPGEMTVWIRSE